MTTILRRLRDSDAGVALIMVLGWTLTLSLVITAGVGYAIQTNLVAHRGQDWGSALSAAQAGIEDYVARLNRNDNYGRTWDCTNAALKGPHETGNTCGWTSTTPSGWIPVIETQPTGPAFHYDVDASNLDKNGTITVFSTGRSGKESRTIEAAIGRGGSTDFLYYTDLEDADPANVVAYPSGTTKYFCGASGAQTNIYWWSPAISGKTRDDNNCVEIGFASGDVLNGRVHFNDTPGLNSPGGTQFVDGFETSDPGCATATAPYYYACLKSSSYKAVFGTPASGSNPAVVVPPTYVAPLYLDDTSAAFANYPGCHYYGATRVKFNVSPAGTMTVWSKDSAGKSTGTGCGTFTAANSYTQTNLAVPTDQVIYVSAGSATHKCLSGEIGDGLPLGTYTGSETTQYTYDQSMLSTDQLCGQGNIYVEGNVKGRVTLAAENSIVVTGDLVLSSGVNGTDLVGLVAGNSVEVYHPWVDTWYKNGSNQWVWKGNAQEVAGWPHRYTDPATGNNNPSSGIQIDASIQTLQHSFWVQQYNQGSAQGTLLVLGSIAQRWRGAVGTSGGTGYIKSYQYDSRLKYSSPPYFPQWTNAKWGPRHTGELQPTYSPTGAYIG